MSVNASVAPKAACVFAIHVNALTVDAQAVCKGTNVCVLMHVLWALFFLVIIFCLSFWEEVLNGV